MEQREIMTQATTREEILIFKQELQMLLQMYLTSQILILMEEHGGWLLLTKLENGLERLSDHLTELTWLEVPEQNLK